MKSPKYIEGVTGSNVVLQFDVSTTGGSRTIAVLPEQMLRLSWPLFLVHLDLEIRTIVEPMNQFFFHVI